MEQHNTILIACGSRSSRNYLRSVLDQRFNLLEATNTRQMLLLLQQNLDAISLLVLDVTNEEAIDTGIQTDQNAVSLLKQIPIVVVADKESYQDLIPYFRYGAADALPLNYDPYAMLHRLETIAQLHLHRRHLESIISQQRENLRHFSDSMVDALAAIIEYRNMESGQHVQRIRSFTEVLLQEVMENCPEYDLTPRLIQMIASASALHDVGKIAIPDSILTKPGALTPEEWEIMKSHTVLGCEMLSSFAPTIDQEYLQFAYNICRHHHERWDGNGYPDGLTGENIPICAQIIGLTDCYDALTASRVYKEAYTHSQAVNMILNGECGSFSPKLLECFKSVAVKFSQLTNAYAQGQDPGKPFTNWFLPTHSAQDGPLSLTDKTQLKYQSIVRYLNVFLMEVHLEKGLFHVVYNPYPELIRLTGANSLDQLAEIVATQVVIPEEQVQMQRLFQEEMPGFVQGHLRRKSFRFHYRPYANDPGGTFEMTFLGSGSPRDGSSIAVLCRKTSQKQELSFRDGSMMENFTECTYVCRNDSGFTLVRAGKDTYSLGGYSPQEVMDLFGGRLLDMAFPEDRARIRGEFDRQLKKGTMVRTEYGFICKDGSIGWVVNKSQLVLGEDGQEYLKTFLFDITASKAAYTEMRNTLDRYKTILSQTENVLFDLDIPNSHLELSDSWAELFGYEPSRSSFAVQLSGETHIHPDDIALLRDRLHLMARGSDYEMVEIRIAAAGGRYLWCRVRGTASRDDQGTLQHIVGVIINIDSEKKQQLALEDKANRDSLTQLLNKNAAQRAIEDHLQRSAGMSACSMILLDLDNFKGVNDTYGHLFGDTLLTQVSRILTNLFHSQDIVSRTGGDEFLVLVRGITDRELLSSQCRRLRDMLIHAFQSETIGLQLGCSIGIALAPEHGSDYTTLFAKADQALYQAKANGKNIYCFYMPDSSTDYLRADRSATPIDSDRDRVAMGAPSSYVIDPDTYSLYLSNGSPVSHTPCYQALFGGSAPCKNCPIPRLQDNKRVWAVIEDPQDHSQILTEAALLQQDGKQLCQLRCRKLS